MPGIKTFEKGLVSICCLSYKHGYFIKDCLDGIWSQSYRNIEIIALDDGSPDNSLEILREYSKKSPFPIKIIEQKNTGNIAKNFNNLLQNSNGEFVSFMSMDDYLELDCILSKIVLFNQDNNLVFIGNKYNNIVDENSKILKTKDSPIKWGDLKYQNASDLLEIEFNFIHSYYIQGCLFKNSIINELGGFDDDLLGDDIIIRTKILKYLIENPHLKFELQDTVSVNYRVHGNNIHQNSFRQVNTVKQWKNRYFPNRNYPHLFFQWLHIALINELKRGNYSKFLQLIDLLQSILKKENKKFSDKYYEIIFKKDVEILKNKKRYLPLIFQVNYVKKIKSITYYLFLIFSITIIRIKKKMYT